MYYGCISVHAKTCSTGVLTISIIHSTSDSNIHNETSIQHDSVPQDTRMIKIVMDNDYRVLGDYHHDH